MARKTSWLSSPFVRLSAYYVVLAVVSYVLVRAFPFLERTFSLGRLAALAQGTGTLGVGVQNTPAVEADPSMTDPLTSAFAALFAMIGSLALLAPVVWVYMLTKQEKGYDESVVHTVVILPVPVTGLVIVVQNSLALAFSLAGIVAAVRFRNTLDDTKDAVYIFLAIGTALAAGAQALGIALVTSLVFNYLVLIMWRLKIGNIIADQLKRTPRMRLGDVLAGAGNTPGAGSGNLTIGDPGLLVELTPNNLGEIAERKARLREAIESAGKSKKYNGLLVVLARGTEECMDQIETILQDRTEHHKLAEIVPAGGGNSTLEYLLALPKGASGTEIIAALRTRAGQNIVAAEFRILKVRKSKEIRTPYWTLPKD